DVDGFASSVREAGGLGGGGGRRVVVVLGAGGAARAVVEALRSARLDPGPIDGLPQGATAPPPLVRVVARRVDRAAGLGDAVHPWTADGLAVAVAGAHMVVDTT